MKTGWLLYDESDLNHNRDFADHMSQLAQQRSCSLLTVRTNQLVMGVHDGGRLFVYKDGKEALPDFVISRQRDDLISTQFESMGVPVFNGARVCKICNDKRRTHQFLAGLPMMETTFVNHRYAVAPAAGHYPVYIKPTGGHGGEQVRLVNNEYEWREAADAILPQDFIEQKAADNAGRDLRVYVLFGQITAAVMRTATQGFLSNFKRGGAVALHSLTTEEEQLTKQVIARFSAADAPLCFAGVDMLYHDGHPVLSEVEDVVGSRMLYRESKLDIAAMYLDAILKRLP